MLCPFNKKRERTTSTPKAASFRECSPVPHAVLDGGGQRCPQDHAHQKLAPLLGTLCGTLKDIGEIGASSAGNPLACGGWKSSAGIPQLFFGEYKAENPFPADMSLLAVFFF